MVQKNVCINIILLLACVLACTCAIWCAEDDSMCKNVRIVTESFKAKDGDELELNYMGPSRECCIVKTRLQFSVLCEGRDGWVLDHQFDGDYKVVVLNGGMSVVLSSSEPPSNKLVVIDIDLRDDSLVVGVEHKELPFEVLRVVPHLMDRRAAFALGRQGHEGGAGLYFTNDLNHWKLVCEDVLDVAWEPSRWALMKFYYLKEHGEARGMYYGMLKSVEGAQVYEDFHEERWIESNQVVSFDVLDGWVYVVTREGDRQVMGRDVKDQTKYQLLQFPDRVKNWNRWRVKLTNHLAFVSVADSADRATLYVGEPNGVRYATNLRDVVMSEDGEVDFVPVECIDVYLANVRDGEGSSTRTMITYHQGAVWDRLKAPQDECESCALNLVGPASGLTQLRPKSRGRMPGAILAVGSVESSDGTLTSAQNTYLSMDAGKSWMRVAEGSNLFEYSSDMTTIGLIPFDRFDDQFVYSTTYGPPWRSCKLPVRVAAQQLWAVGKSSFLIVGKDESNLFWHAILVNPIADPLPSCNSEYIPWLLTDFGDSGCVVGYKTAYTRRNLTAQCVPDPFLCPIFNRIDCACSELDYLCEYCYQPLIDESGARQCVLECPSYNPKLPPTTCNSFWIESSGYQLAPGNNCQGGVQLEGPALLCPTSAPPPSNKYSKFSIYSPLIAIAILLLILLGFLLWHLADRYPPVRRALASILPDQFLPRKPTGNELWGLYQRIDAGAPQDNQNHDIFNDEEFLKKDPNLLDLDDDIPCSPNEEEEEFCEPPPAPPLPL